jgi:hypothetical protein
MKRTLLIATLIFAACAVAPAQTSRANAGARSRTSARAGDALQIDSGTRLAAQLQQTLDVRRARVGDEVVLKTAEAIRSQGRTVVATTDAVSRLRITQTADADVSGGSTLSLLGGNLRLEKSTTFHLVLNESAGVNDRQ